MQLEVLTGTASLPELIGDAEIPQEEFGAGTAYTFVGPTAEAFQDPYDIYICHPVLDTAVLEANTPAHSLKLFYELAPLMQRFATPYFTAKRAVTTDADYWHTGLPYDETTRIPYDANNWYVRPSADLGARLAAFVLAETSSYYDGQFADEAHADIPNGYWTAWSACDPADNGGVTAGRPFWDTQWDAMHAAYMAALKTGFGAARALIANSAGATYAGLDGITIESGHIVSIGEVAALAAFQVQRVFWEASANKYATGPLSIAWDYDLGGPSGIAGLVFRGTIGV